MGGLGGAELAEAGVEGLAGVVLIAAGVGDEVREAMGDGVEILLDGVAESFGGGGGVGTVGAEGFCGMSVEVCEMAGDGAAEVREDAGDFVAEMEGGLVDGVAVRLGVGGGVAAGGGELGVDGGDGVVESGIEGVEAGGGGGFETSEVGGEGVSEGEQAGIG